GRGMSAWRSPLRFLVALVVLVGLPGLFSFARAQEEPKEDRETRSRKIREGTHILRRMLFDEGLKPLDSFRGIDPKRSILIVLGRTDQLTRIRGGISRFVSQGGALLLASDRRIGNRQGRGELSRLAGVSINAESVAGANPASCYRSLPHCPWVVPNVNLPKALPTLFLDPRQPGQLLQVATNVPSHLRVLRTFPGFGGPLAWLPPQCQLETGE